jgi:tetratricopeptide (TPR) repeat protein
VKRADGMTDWTVRAGEVYRLTFDTDRGYGSLVLVRQSETYELAVTNGVNGYTVMSTVQTSPATIDPMHDGWKLRVRVGSHVWGYVDNVRVEHVPSPWVRLPLRNPSFELPDISPLGYEEVTPSHWNFGGGWRDRLAILSTNEPSNAPYVTDGKQCIQLATYQDWQDVKRADGVTDWSVSAGEVYTLMYDSTVSEAYAALAWAYFSKKSLQEAETAARKAIELGPNIFTGYWVLARIYHVVGRDRESVDLLKKTIELNPDFHTAYGDLRMVYEKLGENEKYKEILARLLEVFPRYLSQHPDDARSHIYYGIELAQVGRIDEAKAEVKKALELSPGDPLMLYNAACCYARIGETKAALTSLKESVMAGLQDYDWIRTDPDFDSIREEPEYIELMKGK